MPRKFLFILADGGRARLVERSPETGQFVTIGELDHSAELQQLRKALRASPPVRTHSSTSPRRSAVGREDHFRPAKEAFMAEVADRALAAMRERRLQGVVLAAPPQLVGPLRIRLGKAVTVAAAIRKDLTKTPDHELGAWLDEAVAAAQPTP